MKVNGVYEFEVWRDEKLVSLVGAETEELALTRAANRLDCRTTDIKLIPTDGKKVYFSKLCNPRVW